MTRNWKDARLKVTSEGCCRVCKSYAFVEAAHVAGRTYDEERDGMLYVNPDDIVPLCGPATDRRTCHGKFDLNLQHEFGAAGLESYLRYEEQSRAVLHLGMEGARRRLCGRERK